MIRRYTFSVTVLFLAGALAWAIWRNYYVASDTHGLVLLASYPDMVSERKFPLMSPSLAMWLLEHTDFHYGRCAPLSRGLTCDIPLVAMAGRSFLADATHDNERALRALRTVIKLGAPVDVMHDGFAPVHEAVLFRSPMYLAELLRNGADTSRRAEKPGRPYHGQTATEMARTLFYEKDPQLYAQFVAAAAAQQQVARDAASPRP